MTLSYAALAGSALALALALGSGSATAAVSHTASPDAPMLGTVTVRSHIRPGPNGEMFTEGAVPQIRVRSPDGTRLMPRKDHTSPAVFENLPAGDYRIRAVLRPCDGNCDFLDAPVSPCHKTVHVVGNASFVVHWRVGEDCTITRS